MVNFDFYIFGVPDGFNLFNPTANWNSYFQLFYDESEESSKMTIHRKDDGYVSYNYLRYKIISSEGRSGAFFGMSLIFKNMYCIDNSKLFRFFENLFQNYILPNGLIVRDLADKTNGNARFVLHEFKDQEIEIKNIESIIRKNINSVFSNDFLPLDASFENGNSSLVINISVDADKSTIINCLKKYVWVSISSEYSILPKEELNKSKQAELEKRSNEFTMELLNYSLLNDFSHKEIKAFYDIYLDISKSYDIIKKYSNSQDDLKTLKSKYEDLMEISEKLAINLKKNPSIYLENNINSNKRNNDLSEEEQKKSKKIIDILNRIPILVYPLIIFIVIAALLWFLNSSSKLTGIDIFRLNESVKLYITEAKYFDAWIKIDSLLKDDEGKKSGKELNKILLDSIRNRINIYRSKNTENDYMFAIKLLNESKVYGNSNAEIEIVQIKESLKSLKNSNPSSSNFDSTTIEIKQIKKPNILKQSKKSPSSSNIKLSEIMEEYIITINKCDNDFLNCEPSNIFFKGDKLEIIAKSKSGYIYKGNNYSWKYDDGSKVLARSTTGNPFLCELNEHGKVTIKFVIDDKEVSRVTLLIKAKIGK